MVATLQKMLDDMNHGVYDFTENGKCTGCGECCGRFLPVTREEIERIRRYIKRNHIKEQKHMYPAPLANPPAIDMSCPFLDTSKPKDKCVIYEQRPAICRSFICNDPRAARADPELLEHEFYMVDMRETFFGQGR